MVRTKHNRRDIATATELPPELDRERCLDETQLAGLLNVARITLSQWRQHGEGPAFMRLGRAIRYRLGDVLDWRDAQTIGKRATS